MKVTTASFCSAHATGVSRMRACFVRFSLTDDMKKMRKHTSGGESTDAKNVSQTLVGSCASPTANVFAVHNVMEYCEERRSFSLIGTSLSRFHLLLCKLRGRVAEGCILLSEVSLNLVA